MQRLLRQKVDGQALVFVTLVLSLLIMLVLTCVEIGGRYLELASVEDALRQATRSSVQSFDYAAFARNSQQVRAPSATTTTGCASLDHRDARSTACAVLLANLAGVRGLAETREQTAARVQWTFLPQGGTCTFPRGRAPMTFATPAACATLQPRMKGLLGWGVWTPQIDAADTLDHIDH